MKQGYFNTADSAHLYYEVRGTGRPLVLIHGWQCSHVFWQRNVDELARDFTVVTPDLRGHGNSSKGLHGITIKQFACDVYDLINYLDLKDAVVMGWSMGGPIVLSYFDQFGQEQIKGLGLIDMTPFPFSPEPWNTQGLHGYNMDGFNVIAQRLAYDREAYFETFANNIFKDGKRPAGTQEKQCQIVQAANVANQVIGMETLYIGAASTDANIPISLGIPAITVGWGGKGGGEHTIHEWYEHTETWKGPQRDLLLLLALSGFEGIRKYQLPHITDFNVDFSKE